MEMRLLTPGVHVISFEAKDDYVIVGYCQPSNMIGSRPIPDKIWQEKWKMFAGKMTMVEKRIGEHKPAQTIPDQYKFEEEFKPVIEHEQKS